MKAKTISINSTNVYLGESIVISADAGEDVESYAVAYKVGDTTTATSLGQFTFTESLFEPLFPTSTYLDVTFICTSTFFDKTSQATQVTCRVNITDKYGPTIDSIIDNLPQYNGYYVRGNGTGTLTCNVSTLSSNKSHTVTATISSPDLMPPTTSVSGDVITVNIPAYSGRFRRITITIKVTDSRGLSTETTLDQMIIYPYDPAKIKVLNAYRANEEGQETLNGTYAVIKVAIEDEKSTFRSGYIKINNISYPITSATAEKIVGDGKLDIGTDYDFEVGYISAEMYAESIGALTIKSTLEAQKVPISLLDDGGTRGVSLCEMIKPYDDTFSNSIINYSGESDMRVKKGDKLAVETSFNVVDGRRYITEDVLDNLKFRAMSKTDYINLKNKDFNTVYFVY